MNGYEFVDNVVRPLEHEQLHLICFGFLRQLLNSIRFTDIANVVLQYATEETIFPLFNENFCTVTRESNETGNFIKCVFKNGKGIAKQGNGLIMLVPFVSQIIKNNIKFKTNQKYNKRRLKINFKMSNLVIDNSRNLFQVGLTGIPKHSTNLKDGLKKYLATGLKAHNMDSVLFTKSKPETKPYYLSFSQRGKTESARYESGSCFLNSTYKLWSGQIFKQAGDKLGQYYWRAGDSCDLFIDYQWILAIDDDGNASKEHVQKDKNIQMNDDNHGTLYKLKAFISWQKNDKLLKYERELLAKRFNTDDNGNIWLDFDKNYHLTTFSNTSQELQQNACVIQVTVSHDLLIKQEKS